MVRNIDSFNQKIDKMNSALDEKKDITTSLEVEDKVSKVKMIFLSVITLGVYYAVYQHSHSKQKVYEHIKSELIELQKEINDPKWLIKDMGLSHLPKNDEIFMLPPNFPFDLYLEIIKNNSTEIQKQNLQNIKENIQKKEDKTWEEQEFLKKTELNEVKTNPWEILNYKMDSTDQPVFFFDRLKSQTFKILLTNDQVISYLEKKSLEFNKKENFNNLVSNVKALMSKLIDGPKKQKIEKDLDNLKAT